MALPSTFNLHFRNNSTYQIDFVSSEVVAGGTYPDQPALDTHFGRVNPGTISGQSLQELKDLAMWFDRMQLRDDDVDLPGFQSYNMGQQRQPLLLIQ